ncbi:Serine/threonine-protein kinase [Coemansia sp. RSA 1722]|nr:Serine/threonine-protein kinase [Coemansia sp. RSA 485]KAJ2600923.1 Serine/threonine-protein kinase [Coemansia sp. RSA 1721]KAJ2605054.1 Serine/threonine-protein kinase [Coemansia sp. RSA 1722]KAJ2638407.1 Serine/threonine-protein kinase [Coemansia sp. RSA 1286]
MQSNEQGSTSVSPRQRASVVIGDYELGQQIGKGSFATVYKGLNKRTNTLVAIKSVVRSSLTRRLLENLETEINILRTVRHPSIVELIDCLKSRNHIHLVMEYCALGDLASYLRKRKEHPGLRNEYGGLNINIVRPFVRQLGDAMRFLRSRDVIHRDIKTQNILLVPPPNYVLGESEAHGDIPVIKVADFGFARNLPSTALAETLCGSPLYMAPEILHYEPYDAKADLWSIGAVVYEMMTGKQPFHASNHVELARIIERTNDNIVFPDEKQNDTAVSDFQSQRASLDPVLKDLVRKLLRMKPTDRMSFEDFFAHPALQQHSSDAQPQHPSNTVSPALALAGSNAASNHESNNGRNNQGAAHPHYPPQPYQQQELAQQQPHIFTQQRYPPNRKPSTSNAPAAYYPHQPSSPRLSNHQHNDQQPPNAQPQQHQRKNSLTEDEQALAEREYVVIEKRAVEMNYLADEMESSPQTPVSFYPPRAGGTIHHGPGVARQMTALARAVHNAVSSQYNISTEAANGPLNSRLTNAAGTETSDRRSQQTVFNPLDNELAETFESRHSQGTQQEEPTIRRMEGLAYMAFAMGFLADMKWRLLPPSVTGGKNRQRNTSTSDPLLDPENGYLNPSDVSIEEAFVLYIRALSLLHAAMREASRYWASIHDSAGFSSSAATALPLQSFATTSSSNTGGSNSSVTVSVAFNNAVQWVRAKFNECLDRAEALKQLANGRELDNVAQVSIVQVLYEQALALGKAAAMRELKWIDPLDCDRAYQLAIWMLSAILETTDSATTVNNRNHHESHNGIPETLANSLEDEEEMGVEDRTIVEQFIASIVKRREKLQRRLMQQEE